MKNERIWISWERHTRSKSFASEVGAELIEIVISGNRFKRYIISIAQTISALIKSDAKTVFFQNPSMVLSALIVFFKLFSSKKYVMDCHNAGVFPLEGRSRVLNKISISLIKSVDLVIVTNKPLSDYLSSKGADSAVISDPLPPDFYFNKPSPDIGDKKKLQALFVCTWAKDEPYKKVIDAISRFGDDVELYVTGRYPRGLNIDDLPKNVTLTGFVSDSEYKDLIFRSDFVIDLTLRENCLVCGGYEALSAGVPCIVSDFKVSRSVFKKGFVYTKNDTDSISDSIDKMISEMASLKKDMIEYRDEYRDKVRLNLLSLERFL